MQMQNISGNPQLVAHIRERIAKNPLQAITFREYMEMCLYHPLYGYYTSVRPKIGKDGDYYTSSSAGTVMGEILASFIVKTPERQEGSNLGEKVRVVEWGPGTGRLAKHILDGVRDRHPRCYQNLHYFLVEKSPYHREVIAEQLRDHQEKFTCVSEEHWWQTEERIPAIVLANELLDAFSVHRVQKRGETFYEIGVTWIEEQNTFGETLLPLENEEVKRFLERQPVSFLEGQIVEVNLDAGRWIERIGQTCSKATVLIIDYGDIAEEIYAPHRMNGTLMCYWRHRAHDRPYEHVGEQDITAHVNFSECLRSAEKAGFVVRKLMTQKQFLLENGILEMLSDHGQTDPFHPLVRRNRAVRQLLLSDNMSELFKVLLLQK